MGKGKEKREKKKGETKGGKGERKGGTERGFNEGMGRKMKRGKGKEKIEREGNVKALKGRGNGQGIRKKRE